MVAPSGDPSSQAAAHPDGIGAELVVDEVEAGPSGDGMADNHLRLAELDGEMETRGAAIGAGLDARPGSEQVVDDPDPPVGCRQHQRLPDGLVGIVGRRRPGGRPTSAQLGR